MEDRSSVGSMASVSCSAEVDFACSGRIEVYGSAIRGSCSAVTGSAICSVADYSSCSGLVEVEVTGTWTDEEILLKIFVRRPRRPCSSSKSSSSTIVARERVEIASCAGMADCTDLEGCTRVREVGACRPKS